ncbi:tetraacyldisaccharide 4'-kinase, partial [Escherichia coli]|nr:tetraacyldisaccharide 4'-kinase [Escherichia coli]
DHHPYTDEEIADLIKSADADGLTLITTAKDHVRLLDGSEIARAFAARTQVLDVELVFAHPRTLSRVISETLERARLR